MKGEIDKFIGMLYYNLVYLFIYLFNNNRIN